MKIRSRSSFALKNRQTILRPALSARGFPAAVVCAIAAGLLRLAAAGPEPSKAAPPPERHYTPDRPADILNLKIEIIPDFKARTIQGAAELRFKPVGMPLETLSLDAVDLLVTNVDSSVPLKDWGLEKDKLFLRFAPRLRPGEEARVRIAYSAAPEEGLYFRTPEQGYPAEDTHLFTQGEAITARCWFPCYDAPNEKFATELICWVPEGMTAISNGRLVEDKFDPERNLHMFHWRQDKPHVSYLVALAAGRFRKLEDKWRDVPLTFWTPPSLFPLASNSFACTRDVMKFFEKEIGVPFPWDKYAQVCVHDFVAGGMENTSLTLLTDRTLHPTETENLRSSESLIAHEMAHQWFGDLVTCKEWAHLWLNEGFASYYENLYIGHRYGRDAFLYQMWRDARGVLSHQNDEIPIVWREYSRPDDQFSFRNYPKASWVLHMLRSQLGEPLYRRCIRAYLRRYAFRSADTEDLLEIVEELSGRSWERFADQWLYHGGAPDIKAEYEWDEQRGLAKLTLKQRQKISDKVMVFRFPLTIRFKGKGYDFRRTVEARNQEEQFTFALPAPPRLIRLDPDYTLLARIDFPLPRAMIEAQLEEPKDMLGRLQAVEALAKFKDARSVRLLKERLQKDRFYGVRIAASRGVRIAASRALRQIHNEAAFQALLASTRQRDARVRIQVWRDLTAFPREETRRALCAMIRSERNPDIRAAGIRALGAWPGKETEALLAERLREDSFRNEIAEAAVAAMRKIGKPKFAKLIMDTVRRRGDRFTRAGLAQAFQTAAQLSRDLEDKTPTLEFLKPYLRDRRRQVKLAAIKALGTLGEPSAAPILEALTQAGEEDAVGRAASQALEALRSKDDAKEELARLRGEIADLKRTLRNKERELGKLKAKIEALEKAEGKTEPAGKAK